ncbi:uncharacterized protein LJ206_002387 isoform 1-T1 [Theristicus caerulescens]
MQQAGLGKTRIYYSCGSQVKSQVLLCVNSGRKLTSRKRLKWQRVSKEKRHNKTGVRSSPGRLGPLPRELGTLQQYRSAVRGKERASIGAALARAAARTLPTETVICVQNLTQFQPLPASQGKHCGVSRRCLHNSRYQVRVQCQSSQVIAVEPDNPNQSKNHQKAHSGQQASRFAESSTFSRNAAESQFS